MQTANWPLSQRQKQLSHRVSRHFHKVWLSSAFSFVNPHNASPGFQPKSSLRAQHTLILRLHYVHSAGVRARQFGCKSTFARVHQKKARARERGQSDRERENNKKHAVSERTSSQSLHTLSTTLLPCSGVVHYALCLFDSARWRKQASSSQFGGKYIICALAPNTIYKWRIL